ncbi:amino acid ABC transporter permease [Clostridium sp. KNHs214]|uniref:amino acid ABC transporter permease n=1 Tax=Clostridium sp. KNHs214 TaxID=1540257 RepID=UPI000553F279|nr:amino acid ABC transporter permease [Clostridium sp. KNHs214]
MNTIFDVQYAIKLIPIMLKYVKVTLLLSGLSMIFGVVLAVIISLVFNKKIKILTPILKIYVSFFRGTPLIAQLFLVYFGFVQVMPSLRGMSSFQAAFIVLSLNSSAFMSESIRGAISSIDKGQMDAALSIGMTYGQAMKRIILPQAIRVAIPALSNSFINIVKSSSLASTIGVTEMMASAQMEATSSYRYLEAFTDIAIVYWILILIMSFIQRKIELKLNEWY